MSLLASVVYRDFAHLSAKYFVKRSKYFVELAESFQKIPITSRGSNALPVYNFTAEARRPDRGPSLRESRKQIWVPL